MYLVGNELKTCSASLLTLCRHYRSALLSVCSKKPHMADEQLLSVGGEVKHHSSVAAGVQQHLRRGGGGGEVGVDLTEPADSSVFTFLLPSEMLCTGTEVLKPNVQASD